MFSRRKSARSGRPPQPRYRGHGGWALVQQVSDLGGAGGGRRHGQGRSRGSTGGRKAGRTGSTTQLKARRAGKPKWYDGTPIWAASPVKHFEAPRKSLGGLDPEAAATLIAATTDVALVLDRQGVIRDLSFGSAEMSAEGYGSWIGQPWVDTVTVESRPKVEALLREAAANSATRLAPRESPIGEGCRRTGALFRHPCRQGRRHGGGRSRPAFGRGVAAAAGRRAAVHGARLLAAAPCGDPLPAPVRNGLGGRADRRCLDVARDRSQPRRRRSAGRERQADRRSHVPRGFRRREYAGHQGAAGSGPVSRAKR